MKSPLLPYTRADSISLAVQTQDWFTPVDLRNAYFHVSIAPEQTLFKICLPRTGFPVQFLLTWAHTWTRLIDFSQIMSIATDCIFIKLNLAQRDQALNEEDRELCAALSYGFSEVVHYDYGMVRNGSILLFQ